MDLDLIESKKGSPLLKNLEVNPFASYYLPFALLSNAKQIIFSGYKPTKYRVQHYKTIFHYSYHARYDSKIRSHVTAKAHPNPLLIDSIVYDMT